MKRFALAEALAEALAALFAAPAALELAEVNNGITKNYPVEK